MKFLLVFILSLGLLTSCASNLWKKLDSKQAEEISEHKEFDEMVTIKSIPSEKETGAEIEIDVSEKDVGKSAAKKENARPAEPTIIKAKTDKNAKKTKQTKKKQKSKVSKENNEMEVVAPDLENRPFKVGEKVTLELSYFNMPAGKLILETKPFVEVNGNKSYTFYVAVKTSSLFNMFYKVDNWAETYVDFKKLVPYSHSVRIRESKQVKDTRSYFDWEKNVANFWVKKIDKADDDIKEEKTSWDLLPGSQNVISAFFYQRVFDSAEIDKIHKFRVADSGQNIEFKGKVIRREKINTIAGPFDTIVVKPEFTVNGSFKPVGDIFFWFTDDDQKLLVKLEAKIKIGAIVGEAAEIKRGKN